MEAQPNNGTLNADNPVAEPPSKKIITRRLIIQILIILAVLVAVVLSMMLIVHPTQNSSDSNEKTNESGETAHEYRTVAKFKLGDTTEPFLLTNRQYDDALYVTYRLANGTSCPKTAIAKYDLASNKILWNADITTLGCERNDTKDEIYSDGERILVYNENSEMGNDFVVLNKNDGTRINIRREFINSQLYEKHGKAHSPDGKFYIQKGTAGDRTILGGGRKIEYKGYTYDEEWLEKNEKATVLEVVWAKDSEYVIYYDVCKADSFGYCKKNSKRLVSRHYRAPDTFLRQDEYKAFPSNSSPQFFYYGESEYAIQEQGDNDFALIIFK